MTVKRFSWQGDRSHVAAMIASADLPKSWGDERQLKAWATDLIPIGHGWRGIYSISGYRTEATDDGRGTVYVSVGWLPVAPGQHITEGEQT